MAPARLWFLAILEAARSSTTITGLVLASVVVNLCSLSKRTLVIRYHIFWCLRRALRRFLLPLAFLVRAFWACLSCHFNRSSLGLSRVVPPLTVAGWMMPQSTPATGPSSLFPGPPTLFLLTPTETNHLPALLETVAYRTRLRGRYPRSFSLTQPK